MAKFNTDKKKQDRRNAPMNTAMADKLKGFKGRSSYNPQKNNMIDLPRLTAYEGDGLDHINVYLDPKTELGAILSPFTIHPFVSPFFGRFNSRQGLYFYLLSSNGDEAFRTMVPTRMRNYARNRVSIQAFAPNLKYFMTKALWSQVSGNERAIELLKDNQLPFDAYYSYQYRDGDLVSKVLSRPSHNTIWMIQAVNEISAAVKENREPNFAKFIDRPEELAALEEKFTSVYVPPAPRPKKEKKEKSAEQKMDEVLEKEQSEQPSHEQRVEAVVDSAQELLIAVDPENTTGEVEGFVGVVDQGEITSLTNNDAAPLETVESEPPVEVVDELKPAEPNDVIVSDIPKDVLIPRYTPDA